MKNVLTLPEIDFGQPEAEHDHNAIKFSFYEGENWKRVNSEKRLPFIIGRKGAGKSAIATRFEIQSEENNSTEFVRIVPSKFRHVEVRSLLTHLVNKSASWQYIYSRVWEGIILGQIVKFFLEQMGSGTSYKMSKQLNEKVLEFKEKCPFYVAALDDALSEVIAGYVRGAANKTDELTLIDLRKMLEPYNWNFLTQAIHDDLESNKNIPKKIIIAIDGLDEHWDNSSESLFFLAQLIHVTKSFTAIFSPKIQFLICLRDNIFRGLVDTKSIEYDKIESLIINLEWNSRSLFELIAKRASPSKNDGKSIALLRDLLPESIDGIAVDDYLGRHLLNRPRDYINFFIMLQAECGDKPRAGDGHVRDTIAKYCSNRLVDLDNEFGLIYPGISKCVSGLGKLDDLFDKEALLKNIQNLLNSSAFRREAPELISHYGEAAILARILLSIGAIGYYDSVEHTLRFVHEFSESRVSALWETNEKFGIHPVYRYKGTSNLTDKEREIMSRAPAPAIVVNPPDYLPTKDDLTDLETIEARRSRRITDLVAEINSIETGQHHFRRWENWVTNAVEVCFSSDLINAQSQTRSHLGDKRFELVFDINSEEIPWNEIKLKYKTHRLLIECKNTDEPTDDDFSKLERDMVSLDLNVACLAYRSTKREPGGKFLQHQRSRYSNSKKERVIIAMSQSFLLQCLHKKTVQKSRQNFNSLWRDHLTIWLIS